MTQAPIANTGRSEPRVWTRHPAVLPALVFAVVAAIYLASPVHQLADSKFTLVMTHGLSANGHPYLDQYFPSEVTNSRGRTRPATLPYQMENVDGRVVYGYPWGTPILSLPVIWLGNLFGITVVDSADRYVQDAEQVLQGVAAGLVTAVAIAVIFISARSVLPDRWSLLVALSAALGTSLWSTASRVLWSHTWLVLLLSLAVYLLIHKNRFRPAVWGLMLGTLLGWAFIVRPTAAIPMLAIGVFLATQRRAALAPYALAVAAWLGLAGLVALLTLGTVLPPYHGAGQNLLLRDPLATLTRLGGVLLSPGRGLFIYSPILAIVLILVAAHWRQITARPLALLALGVITIQVGLVAGWEMWWGGHAYGPRLLVDLMPWFVVLTILGLQAHNNGARQSVSGVLGLLAALTMLVSVVMHARGATDWGTLSWNGLPDVDKNTERLWDWSQPPFLATEAPRRR